MVWQPDEITVTVPAAAQTGDVYLGDLPTAPADGPGEDLAAILGSCPLFAAIGARGLVMAVHDRLPFSVCPDYFAMGAGLTVRHPPTIRGFRALDANQADVGSPPIEPGAQVTLDWEAT